MMDRGKSSVSAHTFIGRQQELQELTQLLKYGRKLVTVVAPGGYGKSRLLLELCTQMQNEYTHGVTVVLLAAVSDSKRVLIVTAEALGMQLKGQQEPLTQLADYLREKQLLLYFDNFEHLLDGRDIVESLLSAAPGLQILISSREPLQLKSEYIYQLDALPVDSLPLGKGISSLPPAIQLFADRAQSANPLFMVTDQNLDEIGEICAVLDGVPLAIELAAAWSDALDLQQLRRELREQLDITATAEDVPERHRSVRASCDWSLRLLTEEQQLVLRCVAVFRGGFSLDAASAVIPLQQLPTVLEMLLIKNWIYSAVYDGEQRYLMHDAAIREYAYQQLLNSEDFEVVVQAHASYYARYCSQYSKQLQGHGQLGAVGRLKQELSNILQALDTVLHRTAVEPLELLAAGLAEHLILIGSVRLCRELYLEIVAKARELHSLAAELAGLLGLAEAEVQLGAYAAARAACQQALQLAGTGQRHAAQAQISLLLGEVERLEGRHTQARELASQALQQARSCNVDFLAARALHELARIELTESNYSKARQLSQQVLRIRRELDDLHGTAACLNDIGTTYYREGRLDEARLEHSASLEIRRQLGDLHGIAQSLSNLGNVEFSRCDYPAAWTLYSESLQLRREIGERFGIAACLNNLGNVEYCEGNFADARRLHEEGLAIKREIGDRIGISFSLNNLGNISVQLKQTQRAAQELLEAINIARELHSIEGLLAPLAVSSQLLATCDRLNSAAILSCGLPRHLEQTTIALDPMDRGPLETAEQYLRQKLPTGTLATHRAIGLRMSMSDLAQLAIGELTVLAAGSRTSQSSSGSAPATTSG